MKLNQLSELWPYRINLHNNGCMWTPDSISDIRSLFWYLEDYKVSSVSGGSIWLVKK